MSTPYRAFFLATLFLVACGRTDTPLDASSRNFRRAIQDYLERGRTQSAVLTFNSAQMACVVGVDSDACSDDVRAALRLLTESRFVAADSRPLGRTVYTSTPDGRQYIQPRGVVSTTSDQNGTRRFYGFGIAISYPVTTIDSYTKPGVDAEGAEAVTVWFKVENRPYQWAKAWPPRLGMQSHLGQSASGSAHLVMTDKGWRVTKLSIEWPDPETFPE